MTITKWERAGLPIASRGSKGRPSLYDEMAVRAWATAREQAARDASNGPLDPIQERATKEHFQALIAEQTYLVRQKALLPAEDVARIWRAEVAAVRAVILSSYTTHADRVHRASTLNGLAGVEAELKALAHEVLRELAEPDRPAPGAPAISSKPRRKKAA